MATGTAIQVVVANEDHTFTLDECALSKILLDPRVRDRKVVVLSIAGAFRKGKSFLLNFFLRYFHSQGSEDWIGDPDAPLKGFDSKFGTERNTTGILMWSEPFKMKLANDEEVCVLLMDTQGTFDNKSTVKDCATVFALSTMLSSVQLYNVKDDIQENDLHNLQYFADYARLTQGKTKSIPFQNLNFLVRDWVRPTEYAYGWEGGHKYLETKIGTKIGQHKELKNSRDAINSWFTSIECFLMPYPGSKVVTDPNYDGRFSRLKKDFKTHVQKFVTSSMSSENLVVKEINGNQITGKELCEFFKIYMKMIQGDKLPELMSVYQATVEASKSTAVNNAVDLYTRNMKMVIRSEKPYVDSVKLTQKHEQYRQEAIKSFKSCKMFGKENDLSTDDLNQRISQVFAMVEKKNSENKWKLAGEIGLTAVKVGGVIVATAATGGIAGAAYGISAVGAAATATGAAAAVDVAASAAITIGVAAAQLWAYGKIAATVAGTAATVAGVAAYGGSKNSDSDAEY